jgi:hypothetical protein
VKAALTRRAILAALPLSFLAPQAKAVTTRAPMSDLVRSPMLRKLYSALSHHIDDKGQSGSNIGRPWTIEEQRWGTEWILRGQVSGNPGWIQQGWRALDVGIGWQQEDGSFGRMGSFHSTSLFMEALARACLLDPDKATPARIASIERGCAWLMEPEVESAGLIENAPYTHRCYILAAALGEGGRVTRSPASARRALEWVQRGVARQLPSGINPERGGHDASYQMVGVLHALRYLPTCENETTVAALKRMMRRAVSWELGLLNSAGVINAAGSTRVGHERAGASFKQVNYPEVFEALVFGSISVDPAWAEPATLIGKSRGWL